MTKKLITKTSIFCCILFGWIHIYGQPNDNKDEKIIAESEAFLKEKMKSDQIIGLSAAVIVNDSVIWKNGFGYSDKENKIPMTVNTLVNIGSITKTFTALAVMQLHDKGLININLPLAKYLRQFKPKTNNINVNEITVKSVIIHDSGIQPDVWKNSDLSTGKYTDVVNFINDTYISYPPGMTGLYSNAGYNILGNMIKEISKQDYADYIRKNIFIPFKMNHSGFAFDSLENRTKLYLGGNTVKEYELRDIASGGIYTNMNDFTKYARGLIKAYNGRRSPLIKQATIHEMCKLQNKDVAIETNKKGLGWFMFKNDSAFALYHAGSAGFAHANILLIPEKKAAVIVLTNTAEAGSIAEEFCFSFLTKYQLSLSDLFPPPVTGKIHDAAEKIDLSDSLLKKQIGNYAEPYSYIKIRLENSSLKLIEEKKQYILQPLSATEFLPIEIVANDSLVEKKYVRYMFKDLGTYHFLFIRKGEREYLLGTRLSRINRPLWSKKLGTYEHYGYQMVTGDTKFKQVEIYITEDDVLMLKLTTFGSERTIPLQVISDDYALTSGINSGFGGYNVKFSENKDYQIVDFAGIAFRKKR